MEDYYVEVDDEKKGECQEEGGFYGLKYVVYMVVVDCELNHKEIIVFVLHVEV